MGRGCNQHALPGMGELGEGPWQGPSYMGDSPIQQRRGLNKARQCRCKSVAPPTICVKGDDKPNMAKQIIYSCDQCKKVTDLGDLRAVSAHIYDDNGGEPRVLDLEHVCIECRSDLSRLLKNWQDK